MPISGTSRLLKSTRGTVVASGTWLRSSPSLGVASGALSGKLVRMFHRSASGNRATLARISPMVGGFIPDAVGGGCWLLLLRLLRWRAVRHARGCC
jgi:hypothetical protein